MRCFDSSILLIVMLALAFRVCRNIFQSLTIIVLDNQYHNFSYLNTAVNIAENLRDRGGCACAETEKLVQF